MSESKKIEEELLEEIREARNEMTICMNKAREAEARFRSVVSSAIAEKGMQIDDTALCVNCGRLRSADVQFCVCRQNE